MLRGDSVVLAPEADVAVDVVQFEELARRALTDEEAAAARAALALYGGELLPARTATRPWAEERREQLRLRHLDLLRLDGQWDAVVDVDPGDERAHLELMRRHAADGDRHAALRQFERLDRTLRRELGVAPSREALALRDRLLAEHDTAARTARRADELIGRAAEQSVVEDALLDAVERAQSHRHRPRAGRSGQVLARGRGRRTGAGARLPRRPRHLGRRRRGVALRPGGRGAGRRLPAPPDAARRPARPPP